MVWNSVTKDLDVDLPLTWNSPNLGIHNSSPAYPLDIIGTTYIRDELLIGSPSTTSDGYVELGKNDGSGGNRKMRSGFQPAKTIQSSRNHDHSPGQRGGFRFTLLCATGWGRRRSGHRIRPLLPGPLLGSSNRTAQRLPSFSALFPFVTSSVARLINST